jgi:hypothetical protein
MGIAGTIMEKNQQLWGSIFNKAKGSIFNSKKPEDKEKPRKWTH